MKHQELKSYQRLHRDSFPESLGLRVHRALSWLDKAENESDDPDAQFIFLWIAFNAAYASEIDSREFSEQKHFVLFLEKLVSLDKDKLFYSLIWKHYSGAIRVLIDNPYVFSAFWQFQNNVITEDEFKNKFALSKNAANKALASNDILSVLSIIFSRLYILRNQLVHGGSTWQGKVNRSQILDAVKIMKEVVPLVISLMMTNPSELWGSAVYPVVTE
ncbi:HEPN domain-containing protein [Methylophaga sp. OBS3]|uniref:HEPN domain-containing protein n=1 Tax=Methylophaga sp. OBS3 TaxID=2991934 RepID=UPI002258589B|nr:HEPN domain-containing protein [Methylophaga sp. OBS3]MCX4190820.1 HEPN domain-containing protein [Methylophaga sp. OBS3]